MAKPKTHHLDKHADAIAASAPGDSDDALLTQEEMAAWFRCSEQWLILGRSFPEHALTRLHDLVQTGARL